MLVHIVNKANRAYYSEYLEKMFELREEIFIKQLGWKDLKSIDGKEIDEIDSVEEVEYLLTIDRNGKLVGGCRFSPTNKPHLLNGVLEHFVQRPIKRGYDVWELTRLIPLSPFSDIRKSKAHAYISAAIMEWALMKGVKKIQTVTETNLISLSARLGWKTKLLGMPIEYDTEKEAIAIEYDVTQEALKSTREYYRLHTPVTYIAPPPVEKETIEKSYINFLDSFVTVNNIKPEPNYLH